MISKTCRMLGLEGVLSLLLCELQRRATLKDAEIAGVSILRDLPKQVAEPFRDSNCHHFGQLPQHSGCGASPILAGGEVRCLHCLGSEHRAEGD